MESETKYVALEKFLMNKTENITLTFIEINEIIGAQSFEKFEQVFQKLGNS